MAGVIIWLGFPRGSEVASGAERLRVLAMLNTWNIIPCRS